jgi:hypothetical protein
MKKIVLVSSFCNNEEKILVLRETIQKIKNLNLDVLVLGPSFLEIPYDIIEKCDFFFYTKENPLLCWPIRQYTHWYEHSSSKNKTVVFHRGFPDYGWAALYQTKKLLELGLLFDYDIFHHIIYDIEIDENIEKELLSDDTNLIHQRKNPKNENDIWETTLHFISLDREISKNIIQEITLENYLSGYGFAEDEVTKWRDKFNLKTSEFLIKDKIFYWENFEFFNYSPFDKIKFFLSKNERTTHFVDFNNQEISSVLSENLKIVFYGMDSNDIIKININENEFNLTPISWEIIELPIDSQSINTFTFEYMGEIKDFSKTYKNIMHNQIYYNYKN